jgi:NAD(P)-dependent dehydrogenase (short-subunit alcohol dehydrogenase family)
MLMASSSARVRRPGELLSVAVMSEEPTRAVANGRLSGSTRGLTITRGGPDAIDAAIALRAADLVTTDVDVYSANVELTEATVARRTVGRFSGKVAVITGAAQGIGRATAIVFAREGAQLVLTDIDHNNLDTVVRELRADDVEVDAIAGDIAETGCAQRVIEAATTHFGRVDIVVANAGIIPLSTITEATPEDWDEVMDTDGRGMFLTCKYAVEAMIARGEGAIVCLSSISGVAGQRRQATYGPAKFVASGLAKHLAVECAEHGIRVNAVAPGTIKTERVRQLADEMGGQDYLDAIQRLHPLGRLGEPEEVANAIAFLTSDEASFITGVVLPVDGGYLAQ